LIENEKQYGITKEWAEKFAASAAQVGRGTALSHLDPDMRQLFQDAYESQAEELRAELDEYKALRDGKAAIIARGSLAELPDALIRTRASAGLTERELAARLGVEEGQVRRYEATRYATPPWGRYRPSRRRSASKSASALSYRSRAASEEDKTLSPRRHGDTETRRHGDFGKNLLSLYLCDICYNTLLTIPSFKTGTLKFTSKPTRISLNRRYVSSWASWTGNSFSTDFSSRITLFCTAMSNR